MYFNINALRVSLLISSYLEISYLEGKVLKWCIRMSEIDPVCGMRIDPGRAKYKSVYKGKVYYFCSKWCMEEFDKNPEYYLKSGPRGMSSQIHNK